MSLFSNIMQPCSVYYTYIFPHIGLQVKKTFEYTVCSNLHSSSVPSGSSISVLSMRETTPFCDGGERSQTACHQLVDSAGVWIVL